MTRHSMLYEELNIKTVTNILVKTKEIQKEKNMDHMDHIYIIYTYYKHFKSLNKNVWLTTQVLNDL